MWRRVLIASLSSSLFFASTLAAPCDTETRSYQASLNDVEFNVAVSLQQWWCIFQNIPRDLESRYLVKSSHCLPTSVDVDNNERKSSVLGSGNNGCVLLAFDLKTSKQVALKIVRRAHFELVEELLDDYDEPLKKSFIQSLRSENTLAPREFLTNAFARFDAKYADRLVAYLDWFTDDVLFRRLNTDKEKLPVVFVMEYVENAMTLHAFLKTYPNITFYENRRQALCLFNQILEGVSALHDKNMAHQDLSLYNILVQRETGGFKTCNVSFRIKIIDFGYTSVSSSHLPGSLAVGGAADMFVSPEVIDARKILLIITTVQRRPYLIHPDNDWFRDYLDIFFKMPLGQCDGIMGFNDYYSLEEAALRQRISQNYIYRLKQKMPVVNSKQFLESLDLGRIQMLHEPWMYPNVPNVLYHCYVSHALTQNGNGVMNMLKSDMYSLGTISLFLFTGASYARWSYDTLVNVIPEWVLQKQLVRKFREEFNDGKMGGYNDDGNADVKGFQETLSELMGGFLAVPPIQRTSAENALSDFRQLEKSFA